MSLVLALLGSRHYHQEELSELLHDYAYNFPSITRLYSIGRSVQGRELWVLEISDHPGIHEPGLPWFNYYLPAEHPTSKSILCFHRRYEK